MRSLPLSAAEVVCMTSTNTYTAALGTSMTRVSHIVSNPFTSSRPGDNESDDKVVSRKVRLLLSHACASQLIAKNNVCLAPC